MRVAMIGLAALVVANGPIPFLHNKPPRGGETITYHRPLPPLCLGCPEFTITLGPDGQGIVDVGTAAAAREYRFQATAEAVAAFSRRLRPYRPNGTVEIIPGKLCRRYWTDQFRTDVTWTASDGGVARLSFDGGCDRDKHAKMEAAILAAPKLLPIGSLVGLP